MSRLPERVCQRPGATAAQVTWSETWRDGSVQDEELTALRALHPLLLAPTEEAHHPVVVRTLPGKVRGFVSRIFGWDIEPYAGE